MDRLLTLQYYFTPLPDPNFQYTKITVGIALALIICGLVLSYVRRRKIRDKVLKKMLKKYPGHLQIYGILLLILLIIRENGLPYLSMRFLWILLGLIFLYEVIKTLITFKKTYKTRKRKMEANENKQKYMPTSHKKK